MLDPSVPISIKLLQQVPASVAWKYRVFPKKQGSDSLKLYSDSSDHSNLSKKLSVMFGVNIEIETVASNVIDELLSKHYLKSGDSQAKSLNVESDDFIHAVIGEANALGCSDIHIEKYQERSRIRMRLDGKLIERYELKKEKYHEYVNKIKIISHLDIAEKRLPQDGRILIKGDGYQYDIRVSVLPTLFGEKVVLRLLSSDASRLDIADLGMTENQFTQFAEAIGKTQGLVLISGPTGSGKTTTLYAALKRLNQPLSNILTIEDPIEYTLEGVNQVQLNEKVGLNFSSALRTFLRQDPDIIMVGEIRDVETAQIAIRAAMTGHLVMSTLHTNSAVGIISRLVEMGVPEYLIVDTLNIAVAQRLIRRLCKYCKKEESNLDQLPSALRKYQLNHYFSPNGCSKCHGTGYSGRMAIYEMVKIDHINSKQLLKGESIDLKDSLATNAIDQFIKGNTSLEEIYNYLI